VGTLYLSRKFTIETYILNDGTINTNSDPLTITVLSLAVFQKTNNKTAHLNDRIKSYLVGGDKKSSINPQTHIIRTSLVVVEYERGGFRRIQDQIFKKKKKIISKISNISMREGLRNALWSLYFM